MPGERFTSFTQLFTAVLLVVSGIAVAWFQVYTIADVAGGSLMYIAQAFLLAGSIFGLEYYVKRMSDVIRSHDPGAA